jgi:glyoxylase-like metal-dependent hydrolase (beta-lactamase superfamily II)
VRRLSEVADGVYVATSPVFVTTSTVVTGQDGGALVIDPALTVGELRSLAADLAELGLRPSVGFATHPHWDHVLWSRELGDVPRYAAPSAVDTAVRERDQLLSGLTADQGDSGHDRDLFARLTALPAGADRVPWDGRPAQVLTHSAHAPGHSAVFLPDAGILVAGDMCSDIEIPLLDLDQPDPVGDYRQALDRFADLDVRLVIPGHGAIGDGAEFRRRIAADRAYLDGLERGSDSADDRLNTPWLADEHRKNVSKLHG